MTKRPSSSPRILGTLQHREDRTVTLWVEGEAVLAARPNTRLMAFLLALVAAGLLDD